MTWLWIIGGIVVLMAVGAVWQVVARFFFAFAVAAAILLALHYRHDPGEAMLALASLGGVVVLRRPLFRLLRIWV